MRIGYARVSTEDQTIDLQKDALKRARCRATYEEHATGNNTARPQLEACLKSLREGDTFVVWRLDRLGRNLADLVRLIAELETRRIDFESLTEKIETRSPRTQIPKSLPVRGSSPQRCWPSFGRYCNTLRPAPSTAGLLDQST